MLHLHGYTIADRLHSGPRSRVYVGVRDADGLPVVFKLDAGPPADGDPSSYVSREYRLLQRVQSPGVVRAIALEHSGESDVLVVERFRGLPLSTYRRNRGRVAAADFLKLAICITDSLAAVHEAQIVHKDVKLDNVLVNPSKLDTCLIDFGISAELGRAQRALEQRGLQGTLHYIAPEQTGRIGLGVDFRTDLYSLGASFYELLTGEFPFATKSSQDLIHAHLSLVPPTPEERCSEVPRALSRLVMRLLEKDPECRYQTAQGLCSDLRGCQEEWLRRGAIDPDFALGTRDRSDRLRFTNTMYGHAREARELQACFERVQRGGSALAVLYGPPGIGKSSLTDLLRPRILDAESYVAKAKFDLERREAPYAGFVVLLRSLLDQIFIESAERLERWKADLRQRLGPTAGVLRELAPELPLLIDDLPPVPAVAPAEARERLAFAVARFFGAFARPLSPLVLVLDDLQWADAGSVSLLEFLLRSSELPALLVVATAREEAGALPAATRQLLERLQARSVEVSSIAVGPLTTEEVNAMLADALHRDPAETQWLAQLVSLKTLCNPLLVRRLLELLWERNVLHYEHERGWVWDPAQVAEVDLSDDAATLMLAKLERLPRRTRELLIHASVIGDAFDGELLLKLVSGDRIELLMQLTTLVEQGLLAPCSEGFKFVHDRIRESAQGLMSAEQRATSHGRIARHLLERTPRERIDEKAFEIADHLNLAHAPGTEAERVEALEIYARAGQRALGAGAAATADRYFAVAVSLFQEGDWVARAQLGFDLFLNAAEAAYQTRDLDRVRERLAVLETRSLAPLDAARVVAKRLQLSVMREDVDRALSLTLDALRAFGVRWSADPSWLRVRLEILRTDWLLRRPLDERLFPDAKSTDFSWLAPILIMSAAGPALVRASTKHLVLSTAYILRQYHRHGLPPLRGPSHALSSYTGARLMTLGHLGRVAIYAHAVRGWMARRPSPLTDAKAGFDVNYNESWLEPKKKMAEKFAAAMHGLLQAGEVGYMEYAANEHVRYLALSGEPLAVLTARLRERLESRQEPVTRDTEPLLEGYAHAYGLLCGRTPRIRWDSELQRARERWVDAASALRARLPWIHVLCIFGEFARAFALCEDVRVAPTQGVSPSSLHADHLMFQGLCHAVQARGMRGLRRLWHLRGARRCRRKLRSWTRPGNAVGPMVHLLDAELARLRGAVRPALRAYRITAQKAGEQECRYLVALAHERRAELLRELRRETEADEALRQAVELYAEWGAVAKVQALVG